MLSTLLGQSQNEKAPRAAAHPKTLKDATQLRGIHQSLLVAARDNQGVLPRPGLINRLPYEGRNMPGKGDEDITANTTANLHSAMIMNNYYSSDMLISPVERNPKVSAVGGGDEYNYDLYNVVEDVYWDSNFKADLKTGSDVSYANMPLFGKRTEKHWRDTMDPNFCVFGNRGPKDGKIDPSSYTCGPHGEWSGNLLFGDNHTNYYRTTQPAGVTYKTDAGEFPDNVFAMENGPNGIDIILAFTRSITAAGPELQYD